MSRLISRKAFNSNHWKLQGQLCIIKSCLFPEYLACLEVCTTPISIALNVGPSYSDWLQLNCTHFPRTVFYNSRSSGPYSVQLSASANTFVLGAPHFWQVLVGARDHSGTNLAEMSLLFFSINSQEIHRSPYLHSAPFSIPPFNLHGSPQLGALKYLSCDLITLRQVECHAGSTAHETSMQGP